MKMNLMSSYRDAGLENVRGRLVAKVRRIVPFWGSLEIKYVHLQPTISLVIEQLKFEEVQVEVKHIIQYPKPGIASFSFRLLKASHWPKVPLSRRSF
jgi:hypothetical protein